jgi:transcriptional regulator GlxA family with amidase domain
LNRSNWWIDEGGVVTCCGISAGIDMSLHLSTSRWTGLASATA